MYFSVQMLSYAEMLSKIFAIGFGIVTFYQLVLELPSMRVFPDSSIGRCLCMNKKYWNVRGKGSKIQPFYAFGPGWQVLEMAILHNIISLYKVGR